MKQEISIQQQRTWIISNFGSIFIATTQKNKIKKKRSKDHTSSCSCSLGCSDIYWTTNPNCKVHRGDKLSTEKLFKRTHNVISFCLKRLVVLKSNIIKYSYNSEWHKHERTSRCNKDLYWCYISTYLYRKLRKDKTFKVEQRIKRCRRFKDDWVRNLW